MKTDTPTMDSAWHRAMKNGPNLLACETLLDGGRQLELALAASEKEPGEAKAKERERCIDDVRSLYNEFSAISGRDAAYACQVLDDAIVRLQQEAGEGEK